MAFNVNPVGRVCSNGMEFSLQIEEEYREALAELDDFSHVSVLWWCHFFDEPEYRKMTAVDKPYRDGPGQVGIFATRSPARPNPIALTTTSLISIDHGTGVVTLGYIDAEDGTPVLDIKPYLPATDRIRDVATPRWCADWPRWLEESATFDWTAVFENAQ